MKSLALFDFDGTVTQSDSFTPFIFFACSKRRIAIGVIFLSPFILLYKLGILPTTIMRQLVAFFAFYRRSTAEISAFGKAYATHKLSDVVCDKAKQRLAWHINQGDEVVIVSASLNVYLKNWCDVEGYKLICTELESRNGKLTGRYQGSDCCSGEKVRKIKQEITLEDYHTIYAYGDTKEDFQMLEIADVSYYRWQIQH